MTSRQNLHPNVMRRRNQALNIRTNHLKTWTGKLKSLISLKKKPDNYKELLKEYERKAALARKEISALQKRGAELCD